ncbi:MAG: dTMP kinase, partial [Atopobiaceae bacterium]
MADSPATRSRPGVFVTLEGIDGCGKSTQVARLVSVLESSGREVVALREPGGTNISEKIRALLLDPANGEMSAQCELMLYEAARAQLVREVIEPALERGAVVVCDRFYDSTTAYQCVARGLDARLVGIANSLGSCGVAPDVTLLFDIDPEVAFARATAGGADRLEG